MFVTFLVLGGIVIGVLVASIVIMTVGQHKKNKREALEAAENAQAAAPAETPAEETQAQPEEQPAEEIPQEPQEEPEEQPEEVPQEEEQEEEPEETDDAAEDDEADEADGAKGGTVIAVAAATAGAGDDESFDPRGRTMYAREMTSAMRLMVGCLNPLYDERLYRVTFSYSFKARLALTDDETKEFYADFVEEAARYKKIKVRESRRHQRIGIGRDRIGILFFKGKKLCVAYALGKDEVDYEAMKIEDISDKARFEQTPAMLRFTSGMKCRRAKKLLGQIAEKYGLTRNEEPAYKAEIPTDDREALIRDEEIKIYATLLQRAPAEDK